MSVPVDFGKIVATMRAMTFRDDDLWLLLGGNLMRLPRTAWRLSSRRRPHDARAQPASMGKP